MMESSPGEFAPRNGLPTTLILKHETAATLEQATGMNAQTCQGIKTKQ